MRYRVRHATTHHYSTKVEVSRQTARLVPRSDLRQRCSPTILTVDPEAATRVDEVDYFGNTVTHLSINVPHRSLTLTAETTVEVAPALAPTSRAPWERTRDLLRVPPDPVFVRAEEFIHPSPFIPPLDAARDYADVSFTPGRPLVEAARELTARINADFAYDPEATGISTTTAEVFELGRGVCQDFAHVQISCLRAMGLAARYVSGYLLTRPPPGRPRLVGADASHAWISVWIPGWGWWDLDPTNDAEVSDEHIVCAIGRDFEDVSPIKGVVVGGAEHALRVAVDVEPIDAAAHEETPVDDGTGGDQVSIDGPNF